MVNYITEKEINENFDKILSFANNHYQQALVEEFRRDFTYNNNRLFCGEVIIKIMFEKKYLNLPISILNNEKKYLCPTVVVHDNMSEFKFDLRDYLNPRKFNVLHNDPTILMFREKILYRKNLVDYKNIDEFNISFFDELDKLIATEDMQRILNTDYKPEVPIDWSWCGK